jgi:hypothetical protein
MKIKFVGKTAPAPAFLTIGTEKITLPADQSKAFNHPHGKAITRSFPELYKPVVAKGGKKRKR